MNVQFRTLAPIGGAAEQQGLSHLPGIGSSTFDHVIQAWQARGAVGLRVLVLKPHTWAASNRQRPLAGTTGPSAQMHKTSSSSFGVGAGLGHGSGFMEDRNQGRPQSTMITSTR